MVCVLLCVHGGVCGVVWRCDKSVVYSSGVGTGRGCREGARGRMDGTTTGLL